MEADERPQKLRKLNHVGEESQDVGFEAQELEASGNTTALRNTKSEPTPPQSHPAIQSVEEQEPTQPSRVTAEASSETGITQQPLSKSQLKKRRRKEEWEAGREYRKVKRKEKTKERKERKRILRQQEASERAANGQPVQPIPKKVVRPIQLPVTFVIDCGFDDKMMEKERISLGSQLTRAYSDNLRAPYQSHLVVSSWGGLLKERFETVLSGHHHNWKDITFTDDDFVAAAEKANEVMKGSKSGKLRGVFQKYAGSNATARPDTSTTATATETEPAAIPSENVINTGENEQDTSEAQAADGSIAATSTTEYTSPTSTLPEPEIVYLTSDSPHTLTNLSPYSTYIIGGIVDKNRHKGLCYKIACDRGVRTAKLPIGEFMEMQSRFVLATNHVVEIMLRWLELGDWGEAFLRVIPKRKGGRLRGKDHDSMRDESVETDEEEQDNGDSRSEDDDDDPVDDKDLEQTVTQII